MLQILFAWLAGLLTVAAPCILLPLPIILGGSVGQKNKIRPLFLTLGFVISFTALALLVNFFVSFLGLDPNVLRNIAVILLVVFAIFMIWPTPFERLMSKWNKVITWADQTGRSAGPGNLGGFILGTIIGIIWAPCAGPILGSILTLVALENSLGRAGVMLVAYAIGAALPMLAIAYGGQALTTRIKKIAQYSHRLQQIFGVILILLAGAVYFQYDTVIQAKLLGRFPNFGAQLEEGLIGQRQSDEQNLEPFPAPDFVGINQWLNSEPLTLTELRGQVVLVDFWTYSCINCIRTLPYVTGWYDKYRDYGFTVVGVHSPEFAFEKETENVRRAISRNMIKYPVAQDNNFATWRAYGNHYWPAKYLIDQQGNIVYTHFGEGEYEATEEMIRRLLGLKAESGSVQEPTRNQVRSPEMYFGIDREENLSSAQTPSLQARDYSRPARLSVNEFALEGRWTFARDKVILTEGQGKIQLHFLAAKVFMVAQSPDHPLILNISVDGQPQSAVTVSGADLYTLFDSVDYGDHLIEIEIPESGLEAFTFTFG